jgi:aryl-alcohol dehydrogenase-like predicted oxidoreductase
MMNYKLLGKSGLRVSELMLGTMTFGENWGWGASKEESLKIFNSFTDAGGNFIDTANIYTEGHSEELVGEFVRENRDRYVLATKFTGSITKDNPNSWGNHRKSMKLSLEQSLKRLQTDYIDLYWVHIWDYTTRTEEVMRALDDLVKQGKILYVGVSDAPAWIVSQANMLSELKGWTPFTAIQVEYNLIQRTAEYDLLSMAKAMELGVLAWSPLAAGILTGKFKSETNDSKRSFIAQQGRIDERVNSIVDVVLKISEETGKTPGQVALNWVLAQSDQIFPIVGARKLEQIKDNLQAIDFKLSDKQLEDLDKASKTELIFPYSMWKHKQQMVDFLSKGAGNIVNWKMPFKV